MAKDPRRACHAHCFWPATLTLRPGRPRSARASHSRILPASLSAIAHNPPTLWASADPEAPLHPDNNRRGGITKDEEKAKTPPQNAPPVEVLRVAPAPQRSYLHRRRPPPTPSSPVRLGPRPLHPQGAASRQDPPRAPQAAESTRRPPQLQPTWRATCCLLGCEYIQTQHHALLT